MIDYEKIAQDYALSYADKTRIYFIEKYLSTFNASQGKTMPFTLFPRQKAFLTSLSENKASIAIKHRQAGITTITSAWSTAQMVFADPDSPETILCIGNKLDLAQQIVTKIREFLLQIPRYFWGDDYYSPDPKSEKNKKDIFIKNSQSEIVLFNGCKVFARSSGPNAARGISAVSLLIFDEAAFIENGQEVYAAALAATVSVPHSKTVMISTPNGHDELYYETYRQAVNKENNYNAVEFRWFQDPRFNKNLKWYRPIKDTNENEWIEEDILDRAGNIKYDEQRWRQLEQEGWKPTSPWYEIMCKQFNNDSVRIAQELDVSFAGSSNNVVPDEFIEIHRTLNMRDPITDLKDPMTEDTWFWKPPIDGHRYICAIDPSIGDSSDFTAIEIIDMDGRDENGYPIVEQVMEYLGKKYGDEVGVLANNYASIYNNAFVVGDATGGQFGPCMFTMMSMGYKNFYYEDKSQKTYTIQNKSKSNIFNNRDKLPGFHFQGNRFPVLNNFALKVRNNEFKIRSKRVISQLETWIFKGESGRMDHMSSAHDDTITCLAMALWVMEFSLNKIQSEVNRNKAMLQSFIMAGSSSNKQLMNSSVDIAPKKFELPFYTANNLRKNKQQIIWYNYDIQ